MYAIAALTADQTGGHPLWHLLIVAGGAIGVFLWINAKEYLDRTHDRGATADACVDEAPAPEALTSVRPPNPPILALATASLASGLLHASVSREHFGEAFIFGAFFLVTAAAQTAWAALLVYRPNTKLLIIGAAGNALVIALWALTRTTGLPIGPEPWHPEPIGILDLAATGLETAIVIATTILLARKTALTHHDDIEQRIAKLRHQHPTRIRKLGDPSAHS
jgi:hypothetical protein